jgi:ABC-type branched-subunit amino acid transport system substrate-binding protein
MTEQFREQFRGKNHPALRAHRRSWPAARLLISLLSSMALGLASCEEASRSQLKLGTLLAVSGDLSQYGSSMQNAGSLLINRVNGCGGALGQPVQLVSTDDQTEPIAGAAAMTKLVEGDRVSGVVGGTSSAVATAAVDIAVRNQVVMISPSATGPVFSDRAQKGDFQGFWFRTAPPDSYQGKALAELAWKRGYKTVALLAINNDYGKGLIEAFLPPYLAKGGKVVNRNSPALYPPDSSTFDSVTDAAFSPQPDAVLLIAYPETGALVLKTAYQKGLLGKKTAVLVTDGLKEPKLAELVGKASDGKYIAAGIVGTAASSGGPALKQFEADFTQTYKSAPKVYDPNTWDALAVMVLAAEAAKSNQGPRIQQKIAEVANAPGEAVSDICKALELVRAGKEINYQGASSSVDFNPLGDVSGKYDVWTIEANGSLKTLETLEIKDN